MKAHLLFGFLGSGKTTLAKYLLDQVGTSVKTAIIVNEFGEVGVDGDILRGRSIDVVELNSGCLCCTLRGSLLMAIEELRDKAKVERVIVEATGIAQPSELLDSLAHASGSQQIEVGPLVTVVDCAKMTKLEDMLGDFYLEQIETADLLVANKIDMASPSELTAVTRRLRELNPKAELVFAERGRVPLDVVLGHSSSALVQELMAEWQHENSSAGSFSETHSHASRQCEHDHHHDHHHHDHHDHHHHHHDHQHGSAHSHEGGIAHSTLAHAADGSPLAHEVESFVVHCGSGATAQRWERFFQSLPQNVWRVKGFVQSDQSPTLIQYTMGQLEMTPASHASQDALVFIGSQMDRAFLEAEVAMVTR